MKGVRQPAIERFVEKFLVVDSGCWQWTAARNANGYGTFGPTSGVKAYAHRWIYAECVEPIPPDMEIDHLCSNRGCVNPDHLEVVTHAENIKRNSRSTQEACSKGHVFTEANTYRHSITGTRQCRACNRDRAAASQTTTTEKEVLV